MHIQPGRSSSEPRRTIDESQAAIVRAAELLNAWSLLPPPGPTWTRCECCGVMSPTDEACRGAATCPRCRKAGA